MKQWIAVKILMFVGQEQRKWIDYEVSYLQNN